MFHHAVANGVAKRVGAVGMRLTDEILVYGPDDEVKALPEAVGDVTRAEG